MKRFPIALLLMLIGGLIFATACAGETVVETVIVEKVVPGEDVIQTVVVEKVVTQEAPTEFFGEVVAMNIDTPAAKFSNRVPLNVIMHYDGITEPLMRATHSPPPYYSREPAGAGVADMAQRPALRRVSTVS